MLQLTQLRGARSAVCGRGTMMLWLQLCKGAHGTLGKEGASENSAASKLGSRLFSKSKQTN